MPNPISGAPEMLKQQLPSIEESSVKADEKALEQIEKAHETALETVTESEAPVTPITQTQQVTPQAAAAPFVKDEEFIRVEQVLEDGLGEYYALLPEAAKPKFKLKGEQAAQEITQMLRSAKVQVKRVLELIRNWLLTIPNVNKFFLEQEAKIKTDRIVELAEQLKDEHMKLP